MEVKIKKLNPNAVLPKKAHPTDAGFDLVAVSKEYDNENNVVYGTGLAFEIPVGHVGLLFPRSSNAKKDLILSNSVGVLDSCYRGEVTFKFKSIPKPFNSMPGEFLTYQYNKEYEIGDRIGQLIIMPIPDVDFIEADELSETDRGNGGYGSTGN